MSTSTAKQSINKARTLAMQKLYQYHVDPLAAEDILRAARASNIAGADYLSLLLEEALTEGPQLEEHWRRNTSPEQHVDDVAWAILQVCTWELLHREEIPVRVTLNSAVELAHRFAAENTYKFINAVLHQVAQQQGRLEKEGE